MDWKLTEELLPTYYCPVWCCFCQSEGRSIYRICVYSDVGWSNLLDSPEYIEGKGWVWGEKYYTTPPHKWSYIYL